MNFKHQVKNDSRPHHHSWAPGPYLNSCIQCHAQFFGDKRAVQCADCAYKTEPTDQPVKQFQSDLASLIQSLNVQLTDAGRVRDLQYAFNAGALSAMSILINLLSSKDALLERKPSQFLSHLQSLQPK